MNAAAATWKFDEMSAAVVPERVVVAAWPTHAGVLQLCATAVPDATGFHPGWFARHAIDCPPAILAAAAQRQAEYFAGRLCAQAALAARGMPLAQVGSGALRAPAWPPGWTGSISHTRALAMAVVLPAGGLRGIGIDLEMVPDDAAVADLCDVALCAAERGLIRAAGANAAMLSTLLFSAKESFFKATAACVGRYFDFSAIECVAIQADRLSFIVREQLAPELCIGMRCEIDIALGGRHVLTSFRW